MESSGGHEGRRHRQLSPRCSVGCRCQESWNGQVCPFFNVVGPILPLSSPSASALDSALQDGLGEGVVSSYVAKPGQLTALDGGEERFLGAHIGTDQTPDVVVCFVL